MKSLMIRSASLIAVSACFGLALSGCFGKDEKPEDKKNGKKEVPEVKVNTPTSSSDAVAKLRSAVEAIEGAKDADALYKAAYAAEAEMLSVADYLAETVATDTEDIVKRMIKGFWK